MGSVKADCRRGAAVQRLANTIGGWVRKFRFAAAPGLDCVSGDTAGGELKALADQGIIGVRRREIRIIRVDRKRWFQATAAAGLM